MQQALRLERHATISDALIAALEFKAGKEASRSYKHLVKQVKFEECQVLEDSIKKIIRETLNETRPSNSPLKETRRCYNCGKIRHLQQPGQGTSQDHIRQIDNWNIGQDLGARMKETGEKKVGHRRVHSTEMVASLPQSENLVPDH
ncbi:hypothetical protein NQ318_002671 [Aromia moschata]|uniref:Uncharacterized protein n=1 Tax=Aromia moschata TaxID=1265417 RepID=A0AAV8XW14_9CUCU|nr:hypothetical protein NQ318_002671 [Aromia moschata]